MDGCLPQSSEHFEVSNVATDLCILFYMKFRFSPRHEIAETVADQYYAKAMQSKEGGSEI